MLSKAIHLPSQVGLEQGRSSISCRHWPLSSSPNYKGSMETAGLVANRVRLAACTFSKVRMTSWLTHAMIPCQQLQWVLGMMTLAVYQTVGFWSCQGRAAHVQLSHYQAKELYTMPTESNLQQSHWAEVLYICLKCMYIITLKECDLCEGEVWWFARWWRVTWWCLLWWSVVCDVVKRIAAVCALVKRTVVSCDVLKRCEVKSNVECLWCGWSGMFGPCWNILKHFSLVTSTRKLSFLMFFSRHNHLLDVFVSRKF